MVHIAVLGHGVVGSGVVEVLGKNAIGIERRSGGRSISVKYILDIRDFPGLSYTEKFTKDIHVILNDPDVSVVVEVMGGVHPAYEYVVSSLERGKSVVTSNKELVAAKGASLLAIAEQNNVNFLFEASVGGGIPIIRPLHQCLAANEIDEVAGILNGTTNFILTNMIHKDMSFDTALKMAQDLGYAESDPAADVEGHDTCRKICILASIAFGRHVYPQSVQTEGITGLTLEDLQYADDARCVIKLIGQTHRVGDKAYVRVSPALIPHTSQLAGIDDVFNGILVRGDATGDVVFYGRGAGKFPTASAVIGDIIDCLHTGGNIASLRWIDSDEDNVVDPLDYPAVLYVRCEGNHIMADSLFPGVSMLSRRGQPEHEFAFLTPLLPEREIEAKLSRLEQHGSKVLSKIRMLDY